MNLKKTRRHNKHKQWLTGFLSGNVVLTLGLALPFVISASRSVQAAVCIVFGMAAVTVPMVLLASLIVKRLPDWIRIPIYAVLSMLLLIPVQSLLSGWFPVQIDSLGIYIPILAVNSLTLYFCEVSARKETVLRTLYHSVFGLLGFTFVILIVAALRELFGRGTLWGIPVDGMSFRLSGLLFPFGGCILAAFLAAGAKFVGRLIRELLYRGDLRRPDDPEETVEEDEKPGMGLMETDFPDLPETEGK